jgi:hypothetical protein
MATNTWAPFLEDNPDILFKAKIPDGSRNFSDYYLSQYNNIYNKYLGGLGKAMLAGTDPNQTFSDYLNQFNFKNNWSSLTPWGRGLRNPGRLTWNV